MLCGRSKCPILERFKHLKKLRVRKSISGFSPPRILVGSKLWPDVVVGPLVTEKSDLASKYADPSTWTNLSIDGIVGMLSSLFRSTFRVNVKRASRPTKFLEITQEIAISSRSIDVDVEFEKVPKPVLKFDGILAPMGPSGRVRKLEAGNPKVPSYVYEVVDSNDLKAEKGIWMLYQRGESTYYITRLLSVGLLGIPKNRLLVPTRWSLTAVDAVVSRKLATKLLRYPEIPEIRVFKGAYAGNKYRILLAPGPLAYELVEIWLPGSIWNPEVEAGAWIGTDYEYEYWSVHKFSELGGGYYAMKLPIYEYLTSERRRATVIAIREVTPDYWAPVGSWQMRETLRKMFREGKYEKFSEMKEALKSLQEGLVTPFHKWAEKSALLRDLLQQKRLTEFM